MHVLHKNLKCINPPFISKLIEFKTCLLISVS